MSFYKSELQNVVLPSDGSPIFNTTNTTSNFINKLAEVQNLYGNYEVALTEIIYPNSIQNIPKKVTFKLKAINSNESFSLVKTEIDSGIYNEKRLLNKIKYHIDIWDLSKIQNYFKEVLSKKHSNQIVKINNFTKSKIEQDELTNKVILKIGKSNVIVNNNEINYCVIIDFDIYLKRMLGFTKEISKTNDTIASKIIDIFGQVHILYIYSDIVSQTIVGEKKVSLLQTITIEHPNERLEKLGFLNRVTFENPTFIPISRNNFETISISIRDDSGDLVNFESGKTLVTLQFRKFIK